MENYYCYYSGLRPETRASGRWHWHWPGPPGTRRARDKAHVRARQRESTHVYSDDGKVRVRDHACVCALAASRTVVHTYLVSSSTSILKIRIAGSYDCM